MYNNNIEEIKTLITNYFEGIFYGDTNKLDACFYNKAIIHGDIKGVMYLKTIDQYIESVKNRQSPNDLGEMLKMETIAIEIINKIAIVKLHVPMLGYNYYDYLSLTKTNNEWKIVNKIFTDVT